MGQEQSLPYEQQRSQEQRISYVDDQSSQSRDRYLKSSQDASKGDGSWLSFKHQTKPPEPTLARTPSSRQMGGTDAKPATGRFPARPVTARRTRPATAPISRKKAPPAVSLMDDMSTLLAHEEAKKRTQQEQMQATEDEFLTKVNRFITWNLKRTNKDAPGLSQPGSASKRTIITDVDLTTNWGKKKVAAKEKALAVAHGPTTHAQHGCHAAVLTERNLGNLIEHALADTMRTFSEYQACVHHILKNGASPKLLQTIDLTGENPMSVEEKWAFLRSATEQLLQVYAQRSNAQWIEDQTWSAPQVVDGKGSSSMFAGTVDSGMVQGHIAFMYIDDGRAVETEDSLLSSLIRTDLWQSIKEHCPHKVPTSQRLERLTVAGRHLLQLSLETEKRFGVTALKKLHVIIAVDELQEANMVRQLVLWQFFGMHHKNIMILPLQRYSGFAYNLTAREMQVVESTPKELLGTGHAMYLLNVPMSGYTINEEGTMPEYAGNTPLEWLKENKASWLSTCLFSDIERLRPDAAIDADFLAASSMTFDRHGANMALQVVSGTSEGDVRPHDSIVLRGSVDDRNCDLRLSAMRTVRTYQLLQSHTSSKHYCGTHRYVFKLSALPQMLSDAKLFHASVRLHDFCAFLHLDMGDLTSFKQANCSMIVGHNMHGPTMGVETFDKSWLTTAATNLELQDKVQEFRSRAIALVQSEMLAADMAKANAKAAPSARSLQAVESYRVTEDTPAYGKTGINIVLVCTPEHRNVSKSALKLARMFMHNVVDKIYVVMSMTSSDSKQKADQVLQELTDKELEFNGQLKKTYLVRDSDTRSSDAVKGFCDRVNAGLVVVGSEKLNTASQDLGQVSSSLAFILAKTLTVPVLVVKSGSVGKFAATPASTVRDRLVMMLHLDCTQVAGMVESMSGHLEPSQDLLLFARTKAFDKPGQLSMKSSRIYVQARMAAAHGVALSERSYFHSAPQELPRAVEQDAVDVLVLYVSGELPITKEMEDLLKCAKTSIYIYRNKEVTNNPLANLKI